MNLNDRLKSLFGDVSEKPSFKYVDPDCIEISNFKGFEKLYINYMEKLEKPFAFSVDGYSDFFYRWFAPTLEITTLIDKHSEEFEIIRNFWKSVVGSDPTNKCHCEHCKDSKLIQQIKNRGNVEELRGLVDRLQSEREHVQMDRDVIECQLQGDWPGREFMKHIWDLEIAYGDEAKTKEVLDKMFGNQKQEDMPF